MAIALFFIYSFILSQYNLEFKCMEIEYYEYFILNNNSEVSPEIASDIRSLENKNFLTLNAENSLIEIWIQEEEIFCKNSNVILILFLIMT